MKSFVDQGQHNESLLNHLKATFPDKYNDWKITIIFYSAIHYLKAYAALNKKNIGVTHHEIFINTDSHNKNATFPIQKGAYLLYKDIYQYSRTARYNGMIDPATFETLMEADLQECEKNFDKFKKFLISKKVLSK